MPRFAALRCEVPLSSAEGVFGLVDRKMVKRQERLESTQPSLTARQLESLRGLHSKSRPAQHVARVGPGEFLKLCVLQARQIDMGPAEALCTKKVDTLSPVVRLQLLKQLELARDFSVLARRPSGYASLRALHLPDLSRAMTSIPPSSPSLQPNTCTFFSDAWP